MFSYFHNFVGQNQKRKNGMKRTLVNTVFWINTYLPNQKSVYPFRSEVIDAFREKDKNLDGLMSYEEFVGHETRNELAFKALDTNGDGFVSRSEFKKICPNMTKGVVHQIVSPISNSEPKIFF